MQSRQLGEALCPRLFLSVCWIVKPLYFCLFLRALDFSRAFLIFDFRDLSSLIDSLDSLTSSFRCFMTFRLIPFFLLIAVPLLAKEKTSFSCDKCQEIYRYCNGKIYHLSNDYYYFSTDPDCKKEALETLGAIKAYQDIADILRPANQSAGKIGNGCR